MTFRERMRWMAQMALLVFILAGAGFLSAIIAIRFTVQGREVRVPEIVGMKAGDAQAALADRGITMKIADRVYSPLPVDHVVRQSPEAGTFIKVTQRAHVVLSLGSQQVSVPVLEGQSVRAARIELLRSGLQLGSVASAHLPGHEPDQVIMQNPPPKSTNVGSPRVNLLVALGATEPAYVAPDFTGLMLGEAISRINAAGLRAGGLKFTAVPGGTKGMVIAQSPPRGSRIAARGSIELTVVE